MSWAAFRKLPYVLENYKILWNSVSKIFPSKIELKYGLLQQKKPRKNNWMSFEETDTGDLYQKTQN